MALIINSSKEKMFSQGDFDMNSVQRTTDSLKEAFKQTMLNQEVIFRKQVGSEPPISQELLEGRQGTHYKLQQMPFDLQELASQNICGVDNDFPDKSNTSNHFKNTLEQINNVSDSMNLTLSLSLEGDSWRREGIKRSWFDKEIQSHPRFVIDLEDSSERTLRENKEQDPSLGCTGLITFIGGKDESQVSGFSNLTTPRSVKKDKSNDTAVSSFPVDEGECFQERHSSNRETKESLAGIPCNYMSIKKQQKLTLKNPWLVSHVTISKSHFLPS